jgi:hypothetical protein
MFRYQPMFLYVSEGSIHTWHDRTVSVFLDIVDFHESWYEIYVIRDESSSAVFFYFLQLTTTWPARKSRALEANLAPSNMEFWDNILAINLTLSLCLIN